MGLFSSAPLNFFNGSDTAQPHQDVYSSSSSSSNFDDHSHGYTFGSRNDRLHTEGETHREHVSDSNERGVDSLRNQSESSDQHPGSFPLLRLMAGVASTVAKAALAPQEETESTERTAEQREYQQPYYETANDLFGSSTSQPSGENGSQSNHQNPQEQQQQSYGSSFASGFFSRVAASFLSTETSDSSSSSDSTYPSNTVDELNSDVVRSELVTASTHQPMTAVALFSGSNDNAVNPTQQQMNVHEPQQFHHQQQQQQSVNMFNPLASQVPQMHQAATSNHFQQQQQQQSQLHQVQQQMHQPQTIPQRIFNPGAQTQATFGPPSFGVPQRASTSAPSRSRYAQPAPVFVASDSLQQKTSASLLWG